MRHVHTFRTVTNTHPTSIGPCGFLYLTPRADTLPVATPTRPIAALSFAHGTKRPHLWRRSRLVSASEPFDASPARRSLVACTHCALSFFCFN
ncbi:protein of unknown function [Stenotrophomonas maltophilia]|nr:protein of unknown function [Stenotrophomonas maltophilia]